MQMGYKWKEKQTWSVLVWTVKDITKKMKMKVYIISSGLMEMAVERIAINIGPKYYVGVKLGLICDDCKGHIILFTSL